MSRTKLYSRNIQTRLYEDDVRSIELMVERSGRTVSEEVRDLIKLALVASGEVQSENDGLDT